MRRAIGKVHASGTPEHRAIGAIFPALPGVTDGFTLLAIDSERVLTLVPGGERLDDQKARTRFPVIAGRVRMRP
jgi:hypothetical protein